MIINILNTCIFDRDKVSGYYIVPYDIREARPIECYMLNLVYDGHPVIHMYMGRKELPYISSFLGKCFNPDNTEAYQYFAQENLELIGELDK